VLVNVNGLFLQVFHRPMCLLLLVAAVAAVAAVAQGAFGN
jgi:hypothetical protein